MKKRFMILAIVLCVVAIIAGGIVFFIQRIPPMSEVVPLGASPVHVSLIAPQIGGAWPLSAYIPILASAAGGQPIKSIDLYINGVLYDHKAAPEGWAGKTFATHWSWQPGTTGRFTILAYALDQGGHTGISSPLVLLAGQANGSRSPVTVQAGDTLQSLAESHNIPIAEVKKSNPGVDPAVKLPPGSQVFFPNPPAPITNLHIIQGYPPAQPGQSSSQDGNGPGSIVTPPGNFNNLKPSFINNLQFWLKTQSGSSSALLPPAPALQGDFYQCTVKLRLQNPGLYDDPPSSPEYHEGQQMEEDGFFLYRSQDGGPWERIATWPKIVNVLLDDKNDVEDLPDQYGQVSFYLSAFNAAGETPGDPATIDLDPSLCRAPGADPNQIYMDNGNLILPYSMDLAYFYIQIDGSQAVRVPEGNRSFLPASGVQLNIETYLDTLLDQVQQPDLDLSMEVWGWSGGALQYVGTYKTSLHRSVLTVCSVEGEGGCTGGGGGAWVSQVNLSQDKPIEQQKYELRWLSTNKTQVNQVCMELGAGPFPNNTDYWMMTDAISASCRSYGDVHEGIYLLDLGKELYPPGGGPDAGWGVGQHLYDFSSNWWQGSYQAGQPFSLFMRAIPQVQMEGYFHFSNTVVLHYNTPAVPPGLPPLASTYPSLYDVQILRDTLSEPIFMSYATWGCVIVDQDPTGQYSPDQWVCPQSIQGQSDCGNLVCLVEGFFKGLGEMFDWVKLGFDVMIQEISGGVAEIIPGCSDNPDCASAVEVGVRYGFSYMTGVPPNMPSFDEFVSGDVVPAALDEITGDPTAGEIFSNCSDCQQLVSDQLKTDYIRYADLQSQPDCIHAYEALTLTLQPNCLDPSIVVHPAPGSYNYPGSVLVSITRKTTPESQAITRADADKYQLTLTVSVDNPSNTDLPQGGIYKNVSMSIPWMEPGESRSVAVPLVPCYNHTYNAQYCGEGDAWDAIKPLYYGGTAHMQAKELCYSSESSQAWVPCANGGQDSWDYADPTGP